MFHKYMALNSAACDSMALGTVQDFPRFVHSLSTLKEHFITDYCKKT
jgi:hypothetical protein